VKPTFSVDRVDVDNLARTLKALLFAKVLRVFDPMAPSRLARLVALPILPRPKASPFANAAAWLKAGPRPKGLDNSRIT
jgi:hypothetical protein